MCEIEVKQQGELMADSTCPKCSSHSFELKEHTPKGSGYKMHFIQCSSCGAVVGVTDYHDMATLLQQLASRLGVSLRL
jgi:uncharacterized Zn finger protein